MNEFKKKQPASQKSIDVWTTLVRGSIWLKGQDIIRNFPTAKVVSSSRARFKIVGNKFRLIIEVNYLDQYVDVRFISTHEEYDKITAKII